MYDGVSVLPGNSLLPQIVVQVSGKNIFFPWLFETAGNVLFSDFAQKTLCAFFDF